MPNKIVAISTAIADTVRRTMRAPVYGFPAHQELATDAAPCRHCLRLIIPRVDEAILFTYDRFTGVEKLPQPGRFTCTQENVPDTMSTAVSPKNFEAVHARLRLMRGADSSSRRNILTMGHSRLLSSGCFQTAKSIICR